MNDTIIAITTPVGESAIGVLRLSGSKTFQICGRLFFGKNKAGEFKDRSVHFGNIQSPVSNEELDEVLLTAFHAPHSYTGEDVAEISCHGNPFILKEILNVFLGAGCRLANPGEFTERAYLNGKMDLSRAEAVNDLIRAHTRYARISALSQLTGKLAAKIEDIRVNILDLLAQLEAAIDHSDLEEEFIAPDVVRNSIHSIQAKIKSLLQTASAGKITREGLKVAIIGAPNTGKSSLLNYLLAEDRAIVSDIPGTTRDTIEEELSIRGIPVRIIDTAGLRESGDAIERMGIERTRKAIEDAELRLVILDASREIENDDRRLLESIKDKNNLYILNKTDLKPELSVESIESKIGIKPIPVSVKTRTGLDKIEKAIEEYYFSFGYDPSHDVLVTNARHETQLRTALEKLEQALESIERKLSEEFIASSIRGSLKAIEDICGKSPDDAILDRIFSKFCIGK